MSLSTALLTGFFYVSFLSPPSKWPSKCPSKWPSKWPYK